MGQGLARTAFGCWGFGGIGRGLRVGCRGQGFGAGFGIFGDLKRATGRMPEPRFGEFRRVG